MRFPILSRLNGRLRLGRLLSSVSPVERVTLDGDIIIELDLRVPQFRGYYFLNQLVIASDLVLIPRLLNPNDVVVDVGAHIGVYALLAAKYAARVIAFEPSPNICHYMEHNLALNPRLAERITLHRLALSDHEGNAVLYCSDTDPGTTSLRPPSFTQSRAISVPITKLDNFLGATKVNFLKIDIEGAELDALRGGQNLLKSSQPLILCELYEPPQRRFGRSVTDLVTWLGDLGYVGFEASGDSHGGQLRIEPLQTDRLLHHPESVINALFIPQPYIESVLARINRISL